MIIKIGCIKGLLLGWRHFFWHHNSKLRVFKLSKCKEYIVIFFAPKMYSSSFYMLKKNQKVSLLYVPVQIEAANSCQKVWTASIFGPREILYFVCLGN